MSEAQRHSDKEAEAVERGVGCDGGLWVPWRDRLLLMVREMTADRKKGRLSDSERLLCIVLGHVLLAMEEDELLHIMEVILQERERLAQLRLAVEEVEEALASFPDPPQSFQSRA